MKQEINPKVAIGIAVVLVLLIAGGMYTAFGKSPPQPTVTNYTKEQLSDPDPPHRGQPGYRERITDTPVPGGPDSSPAPGAGR